MLLSEERVRELDGILAKPLVWLSEDERDIICNNIGAVLAAYRELAEALKSDGVYTLLANWPVSFTLTSRGVNEIVETLALSRALRGEGK